MHMGGKEPVGGSLWDTPNAHSRLTCRGQGEPHRPQHKDGRRESQEPGAVEGGFYRVLTHKGGRGGSTEDGGAECS